MLLSPVAPILASVSTSLGYLVLDIAAWPVAVAALVAAAAWMVLSALTRRPRASALAVSLVMVTFLGHHMVVDAARFLHVPQLALLTPLFLGAVIVAIFRFAGAAEGWTVFANALTAAVTMFVASPLLVTQYQAWRSPSQPLEPFELPRARTTPLPDIYVLILDGYGRADVLRDYYGFTNPLPSDLEALGFTVAHGAASNYAQTSQSLASLLNVEYLPALLERQPSSGAVPRRRYADLIARNRMFATLAKAGYRIRAYASEYSLVVPAEVDERPHPRFYLTEFGFTLYDRTMSPLLSAAAGRSPAALATMLHRGHITWTLDHLRRELPEAGDPPTVVFAHLLIPHPPFSFEPDGRPFRSRLPALFDDGSHWKGLAANTGERYEAGYVKSLQFLNGRLLDIVRAVVNRPGGRQAVIYLQGDHGPGSRLEWNDWEKTDFRERLGILLAMRLPDGARPAMPANVTPVNAGRVLLNSVLGTSVPMLEDRSYFSPWREPLRFIDVTSHVRSNAGVN